MNWCPSDREMVGGERFMKTFTSSLRMYQMFRKDHKRDGQKTEVCDN